MILGITDTTDMQDGTAGSGVLIMPDGTADGILTGTDTTTAGTPATDITMEHSTLTHGEA